MTKPVDIKARVELDVKKAFERRAKAKGVRPSERLRALVMADLGADANQGEPIKAEVLSDEPEKAEAVRFEVRLPRFLLDGAEARADIKGMSLPRWLVSLVQSQLMAEPVMTEKEIVALRAMTRELSAIGRNVNQIAKALNSAIDGIERSRVSLDDLKRLDRDITVTKKVIRSLILKSQQSWGVPSANALTPEAKK